MFDKVKPNGATPTGERLDQILKPRIVELEAAKIDADGTPKNRKTGEIVKRVNFIVITDGQASKQFIFNLVSNVLTFIKRTVADSPKWPIIDAAARLKAISNLCLIQVG